MQEKNYYEKFESIEDEAIRYIAYSLYKINKIEQVNLQKETRVNVTKKEIDNICLALLSDDKLAEYIEEASKILQNYLDELLEEEILHIENSLSDKHNKEILSITKEWSDKYSGLKIEIEKLNKPWVYGFFQSFIASLAFLALPAIMYAIYFVINHGWDKLFDLFTIK